MHCPQHLLLKWLLATLALLTTVAGSAQEDREYQIKAAFLYQFATYVEWPGTAFESADSPLYFNVIGADSLRDNLAGLAQEHTVNGRPIRLLEPGGADSGRYPHILFIGRNAASTSNLGQSNPQLFPTLVVTEAEPASAATGMINFRVVDNRIRFDVALPDAEAAGLRLSSRLLQVAREVVRQR